jgi:hypothetical protein
MVLIRKYLLWFVALGLVVIITGCAKPVESQPAQTSRAAIVQYLPPHYYACTEANTSDLLNAYYSRYNAVPDAENVLNGHVFVFKNIAIQGLSVKNATDAYIWVNGVIQCYFLVPGSQSLLHEGDIVDVVGIDAGVGKDYSGTLIFTGCVFLPAGSVQLPAGDSGLTLPTY